MATKWEYMRLQCDNEAGNFSEIAVELLDEQGREGWEVVSASWRIWGGNSYLDSALLKRERVQVELKEA